VSLKRTTQGTPVFIVEVTNAPTKAQLQLQKTFVLREHVNEYRKGEQVVKSTTCCGGVNEYRKVVQVVLAITKNITCCSEGLYARISSTSFSKKASSDPQKSIDMGGALIGLE
jgi:hypothetical protein